MPVSLPPGLPYLLLKGAYSDAFVLHEDSEKCQQREDVRAGHFLSAETPGMVLDADPRKDLDEKWTQFFKFQPMWLIRNYFGEKIGFYFAWTGMLITTLWIPMLFGLAVFFYGLYERYVAVSFYACTRMWNDAIISCARGCISDLIRCLLH